MAKIPVRPGVYQGMPFANYVNAEGINGSALSWGLKSARHIKAYLDGEIKRASDSDDMRFGRALHSSLLEPEQYKVDWEITPGCQKTLKTGDNAGKPCGASTYIQYPVDGKAMWLCKKHAGKELAELGVRAENAIKIEDAVRVEGASQALKAEPAIHLLRARGGCEESIFCEFEAEEFGIPIKAKARLDKSVPKNDRLILPPLIVDLKKVQVGKATDEECAWAIYRYGYDVKAAWYRKVYKKAMGEDPSFIWVFVEDNPPYGINVIQCDHDTEVVGELRLRECIRKYVWGVKNGEWPGYLEDHTRPRSGGLPDSIKKRWL